MTSASPAFETILSAAQLQALLDAGKDVLILDCEFDLNDPDRGRAIYRDGHLPGARYIDLKRDLSGAVTGRNGRHPLPDRELFAATMRLVGLKGGQQVVAYDGSGGIYAARLWWMLRWLGHAPVAVLDGGRQAWVASGLPLAPGEEPALPIGGFEAGASLVGEPVTVGEVEANLVSGSWQVIDARDAARFGGAAHPLDDVAGHIPGATNRSCRDNLNAEGRFRDSDTLREAFTPAVAGKRAEDVVSQCGSGVTACHNILAMELAGLKGARLYPGSWSEWTADPLRPVEKGA
jgi:thiosulfate/3-mercaptopyruvate sulfurtransferase